MSRVISKNKKIFHNFEILDKFEAGIQLLGWEVKSIRNNNFNFKNAFCVLKNNEFFLQNMHISLYMNVLGDELRLRKLLLHKNEINKIKKLLQIKGITSAPLELKWSQSGFIKLTIAVVKHKSKYDKREAIKKRDFERKKKLIY